MLKPVSYEPSYPQPKCGRFFTAVPEKTNYQVSGLLRFFLFIHFTISSIFLSFISYHELLEFFTSSYIFL